MKPKAKNLGDKLVTKEVPKPLEGLGVSRGAVYKAQRSRRRRVHPEAALLTSPSFAQSAVPPLIREAYLAVARADPGQREAPAAALKAAAAADKCAASCLALAKGSVYRAMDLAGTKTAVGIAQVERDEQAAKLLASAADAALLGAAVFGSRLCLILLSRLLAIIVDMPYASADARGVAMKLVGVTTRLDEAAIVAGLRDAKTRVALFKRGTKDAEPGREVIAEDAWPFEELACSGGERLRLLLDHARGSLRVVAKGLDSGAGGVGAFSEAQLLFIAYVWYKNVCSMRDDPAALAAADERPNAASLKARTEEFKGWLLKNKDELATRLALGPFAPRAEALRLGKAVSAGVHAKVKGEWWWW